MTQLTKQRIFEADGETISSMVLAYCLNRDEQMDIIHKQNSMGVIDDMWQPHLPTEKGKAQCWDLAQKCELTLVFGPDGIEVFDGDFPIIFGGQTAILKACLLSVLAQQENSNDIC